MCSRTLIFTGICDLRRKAITLFTLNLESGVSCSIQALAAVSEVEDEEVVILASRVHWSPTAAFSAVLAGMGRTLSANKQRGDASRLRSIP